MDSKHEIRDVVSSYVRGDIGVDRLRSFVLSRSMTEPRLDRDPDTFLAEVGLLISEHSAGHWGESELRRLLDREIRTVVFEFGGSTELFVKTGTSARTSTPIVVMSHFESAGRPPLAAHA
jgi:hypothetical protein